MVDFHFDDTIKVDRLDPDGKKYDKVSRIQAWSEEYDMHVLLDVNTELYPTCVGDKFRMVLSQSLNLDGSEGKQKSLADKFEYVMHGLLYKISEDTSGASMEVVICVSFGGLQLMLKGVPSRMGKFKVDQRLFLLMRKV
ncbi:hypothetical protein LguiB_011126 [Lonicera macranthoides]